jgi:hypothetical protein
MSLSNLFSFIFNLIITIKVKVAKEKKILCIKPY